MSGIGGGVLHILYEQVEDKRIWNACIYVLFTYWLGQKEEQTNSALFTCTLAVCEEPEGLSSVCTCMGSFTSLHFLCALSNFISWKYV